MTEFWAVSATASAAWMVPATTSPGGKPVTALPGLTPTSPLIVLGTGIGHGRAAQHGEALRRPERRRGLRRGGRGAAEERGESDADHETPALRFMLIVPSLTVTFTPGVHESVTVARNRRTAVQF